MFVRSAAFFVRRFITASTLALVTWLPANAQENAAEQITDIEVDVYDEIVVRGDPTLRLMQDELFAAEDNFYDLYNALNAGQQFDIHCVYRVRVGSQIRRRICEASFVKSEYRPPTVVGRATFRAFVAHKTKNV